MKKESRCYESTQELIIFYPSFEMVMVHLNNTAVGSNKTLFEMPIKRTKWNYSTVRHNTQPTQWLFVMICLMRVLQLPI
jgi:hypothetical protein